MRVKTKLRRHYGKKVLGVKYVTLRKYKKRKKISRLIDIFTSNMQWALASTRLIGTYGYFEPTSPPISMNVDFGECAKAWRARDNYKKLTGDIKELYKNMKYLSAENLLKE